MGGGLVYNPTTDELRRAVDRLRTDVDGFKSGLTPFNPTWENSSGTQVKIGNGLIEGSYVRFGPLCHISIYMRIGAGMVLGDPSSSLTYWVFGLPFPAAVMSLGSALFRDTGFTNRVGISMAAWAQGREQTVIAVPEQSGLAAGSDVPFTWGEGDEMRLSLTYPVAGAGGVQFAASL